VNGQSGELFQIVIEFAEVEQKQVCEIVMVLVATNKLNTRIQVAIHIHAIGKTSIDKINVIQENQESGFFFECLS
jgi:hypothetical protein